jgi:hypothetical protein
MERTMRHTWRRLATIAALAGAVFATTATLAAPAHALGRPVYDYGCTFASERPQYVGWAKLSFRGCVSPGSAQTMDCKGDLAWRWTGRAWQQHPINECSGGLGAVYVYPYAAGWSWIWTQRTGWLAVRSNLVVVSEGYLVG